MIFLSYFRKIFIKKIICDFVIINYVLTNYVFKNYQFNASITNQICIKSVYKINIIMHC